MKKIKEETIQATVTAMMDQLNKHRMLKSNKDSASDKTEKLLYAYPKLKVTKAKRLDEIELIRAEGINRTSTSLVTLSHNHTYKSNFELAEDRIAAIQLSIKKLEEHIDFIDAALDKIASDPYFDIIRLKYFEEKTGEEIAEIFEVDVSTITRNKNRLINKLSIHLFPDDSLFELFDW